MKSGRVTHAQSHVSPLASVKVPLKVRRAGHELAATLQQDKAIMGVFDEGCMGMFNAIIPDHLLNPTGVYKERLSQSALYHETTCVSDREARDVRQWLEKRGMTFPTGPKHETDLSDSQVGLK